MRRKKDAPLLTDREVEILRLISQGHSNQEIADILWMRKQTTSNMIHTIMMKTFLFRRVQLTIYALKQNLISLNEIDV